MSIWDTTSLCFNKLLRSILRCSSSLLFVLCFFMILISEGSFLLSYVLWTAKTTVVITFHYLVLASFDLRASALIDFKRRVFLASVSIIRRAVLAFSRRYIKNESHSGRFHLLVFIFVCSMALLIISPDFFTLIVGWDGLGVRSFLLVVYFQNNTSWNSGILTLISNRVGDVLLIRGRGILYRRGSLNFTALGQDTRRLRFAGIALFLISVCTKRAQLPFSAWLPAAIAAPTPVSALVHSSTLVTAGVYLRIRLEGIFASSGGARYLLYAGTITIFLARGRAMFEYDMKKIVALSTLSQLGLMMTCLGLGLRDLAYFHMLTHAFFKSLLFMATGSLMHSVARSQDLRGIFLRFKNMPVTGALIISRNLRLIGLPFLSGFYAKDAFLESALSGGSVEVILCALFFIRTGFTALYTLRFTHLVFCESKETPPLVWTREDDLSLIRPRFGQFSLSILGGAILAWSQGGPTDFFNLRIRIKNLVLPIILLVILIFSAGMLLTLSQSRRFALKFLGRLWGMPFCIKSLAIREQATAFDSYFKGGENFSLGYISSQRGGQLAFNIQGLAAPHKNGVGLILPAMIFWGLLVNLF